MIFFSLAVAVFDLWGTSRKPEMKISLCYLCVTVFDWNNLSSCVSVVKSNYFQGHGIFPIDTSHVAFVEAPTGNRK